MVKILGINVKIIIAILYVYYCEINAETQILDSRSSISDNGPGRRAQTTKKKPFSESKKEKVELRHSKGGDPDKFTRGVRAEIKLSPPKHYPKHDPPHVEPVLRNFEDPSSDSDVNKNKNRDRHKYYIMDWGRNKGRFHDSDDDHKMDKNENRNPTTNKDISHSIDKSHNRNRNSTTSKDIYKSHVKNRGSSRNKDHNVDRNSNTNKEQHINKDKEKNHVRDKSHNKNKNQYMDRTQDKDKSNKMEESDENDHKSQKYPRKERHSEKSRSKDNRLGGPMRIPKLNPEPLQGRILALERTTKRSTTHHHRSKLRTHTPTEEEHIQSTRMTPMYLMNQQVDGEGNQPLQETSNTPYFLSPYSLTSQLTRIMNEFPEANATIESIGRTVEYNDIVLLKITEKKSDTGKYFRAEESKYIDEVPEKKIIFIVHGLSVMGMDQLGCLNSEHGFKILLSYYLAHLQKFDIFIIPMANPDGYSASHSMSMWNKNVSPQEACAGVMLDRNFDVAWNATRQISSCSQMFPGTVPFSEIETKAVRDVFHYHGHKILAYIHVHVGTYTNLVFKGDAILYPRGYSESQTDDDKYIDLKGEIDEAMKNASFQVLSVTVDTLYNWYGRVTGSSVDYASTVYGIPYALEFVMQLYDGQGEHDTMEHYALTEIWSRLIETTFNNIWKSLHNNEIRRK